MNIALAIPEIFLLSMACVVLLLDLVFKDKNRFVTYMSAIAVLGATALFVLAEFSPDKATAFYGMYAADNLANVLKLSVLLVMMGVFIYSRAYLQERNIFKGEFYLLSLLATLGMMIMISANTLLVVYLGLELLSLALYALVAFNRDNKKSSEAAMKYFILGAIASGMLLYGMSIIYGLSGSLNLYDIAAYVSSQSVMTNIVLLFGISFIVAGLGFKFGVAPFHMWVPDVYHGASTIVTMILGTAPKIAAFAIAMRLLVIGMESGAEGWQQMLVLLSVLSLIIGNVIAIAQTNIKRMFAYSTISHMGFILLGILSANETGYAASMFYAITYAVTAMGGFAIIILLSRAGFEADELTDLRGLSTRHPWYAFAMLLFLFAMAGFPPLVGFYAKFAVLEAAVHAGYLGLAVLAVLMSVIGAFYYLRAVKIMYFEEVSEDVDSANSVHLSFKSLLMINGIFVVFLGLFPGILMSICLKAIQYGL
ncbi:MAG TPA: NADH-quinone oxidoreductase subunit NuoN [Thiothrix sp.]|nr:NADH-quinone oxidoreductase subunit NuoN [Thiothrix sp.]